MMLNGKKALVLYEPVGIVELLRQARKRCGANELVVIALDYEVEREIRRMGVSCVSVASFYAESKVAEQLVPVARMATGWYEAPSMRFFAHGGNPLGRAYEWMLMQYVWRALYGAAALRWLFETHGVPDEVFVSPTSVLLAETTAPLAKFEVNAHFDIVREESARRGIPFTVLSPAAFSQKIDFRVAAHSFANTAFVSPLISLYNALMSVLVPRRGLRIYSTEFWKNIESFVGDLPDAELVMMDRREAPRLFRLSFKKRLRFYRPRDFLSGGSRARVRAEVASFRAQWKTLGERPDFAGMFFCAGIDLWPIARPALEHLVTKASLKLLEDLHGSERMFRRLSINRVLVRASVSSQTHFYALARSARALGIPCIELQHGLEYLEPGSVSPRKNAEYVAAYGSDTADRLTAAGFPRQNIFEIGSPRFDRYVRKDRAMPPESEPPTLLCLPPNPDDSFRSYEFAQMVAMVQEATASFPSLRIMWKLHPGVSRRSFCEAVIKDASGAGQTIVERVPLTELLDRASMALSVFSTAELEIALAGVPLIACTAQPATRLLQEYQFSELARRGGIRFAADAAALADAIGHLREPAQRARQVGIASNWLKENFCFDGRASERLVALMTHIRTCLKNNGLARGGFFEREWPAQREVMPRITEREPLPFAAEKSASQRPRVSEVIFETGSSKRDEPAAPHS